MGARPTVGYCAKGLYLCSVNVFSKVPGLQFREEMKAAAALVCTALLFTALAAGPGIWSLIQEHLGPRAPYATGAAGAVRDQRIEFGAAAALADRNTVRVSPFGIWRESG